MKKIIFLLLVISELTTIAFLAGKVYLNRSVLGENISINPILRNDIIFPYTYGDSDLKNFYELAPNIKINNKPDWIPSDYTYSVTTNADGLNERFDYPTEKESNVFRIMTIGDSYTYGAYVNTKENYPERLEDILNDNSLCRTERKFEVINLGVGGYDIEYSVVRFKVRGQKYNPDLVLWLVKDDDFALLNELVKPKKDQYKREIMSDHVLYAQLRSEGDFYPWSKKVSQELREEIGEEGVLAYNRKALERISDYYKGQLVFTTFTQNLNGSYVSMLQDFVKMRRDTYIYDSLTLSYDRFEDWHPTGRGYEQIAGQIFDYLKQSGLIPCDSL